MLVLTYYRRNGNILFLVSMLVSGGNYLLSIDQLWEKN